MDFACNGSAELNCYNFSAIYSILCLNVSLCRALFPPRVKRQISRRIFGNPGNPFFIPFVPVPSLENITFPCRLLQGNRFFIVGIRISSAVFPSVQFVADRITHRYSALCRLSASVLRLCGDHRGSGLLCRYFSIFISHLSAKDTNAS